MNFVLDASVTLAWCFPDEAEAYPDRVLDALVEEEAVVPTIWPREVTNALLVGVRRGRLTDRDARQALLRLDALPIVVEPLSRRQVFGETARLGRRHELSSYDASYLELAIRRALPLASTDRVLMEAAAREGVPGFA